MVDSCNNTASVPQMQPAQPELPEAIRRHYPYTSHWFKAKEGWIHYLDERKKDEDQECVLMLHGNPTWSFFYRKLIDDLKGRYRCIAPDHLGCGLSDKPQHANYTLAGHVQNIQALADELDLKNITLVVHDWGGSIGTRFALNNPQRIRRMVIFNTAAFLSDDIPYRIALCRMGKLGQWGVRSLNLFSGLALRMAVKKRMSRSVEEAFVYPYNSWENRVAVHRFVMDIPMEKDHPTRSLIEDMQNRLPELSAIPKIFIWGMEDFCFHAGFLRRWLEYFPNSQVHRLKDVGHYLMEDAFEQVSFPVRKFLLES